MFTAYLAGVIDSDGSISIIKSHPKRPNPSYTASIQISWIHRPKVLKVFETIQKQYGGNITETTRSAGYETAETHIYRYNITAKQAKKLLEDILPFLQLKRQQCRLALRLINSTKRGEYGMGRPKPEKLKEFHHKLYLMNKNINTKNGKTKCK